MYYPMALDIKLGGLFQYTNIKGTESKTENHNQVKKRTETLRKKRESPGERVPGQRKGEDSRL